MATPSGFPLYTTLPELPDLEKLDPETRDELLRYLRDLSYSVERRDRLSTEYTFSKDIDVRDYGAVADGITDDAPAFITAVEDIGASGGGVLNVPGGRYLMGSPVPVNYNGVIIIGRGREAALDFSPGGAAGHGFLLSSVSGVRISGLEIKGGAVVGTPPGSAFFLTGASSRCSFDFNYIHDWGYGFQSASVNEILSTSRIAFNYLENIKTANAAIRMNDCRFNTNHESVGAVTATSEYPGSDNNVFTGNVFQVNPTLQGARTVFSPDANTIPVLSTLADIINGANPTVQSYVQYVRNRRTVNSNINFDSLTIQGALPYVGRRMVVHLVGGLAARTIMMRDKATSGAGTGGFELHDNADLFCANSEEWLVELRVSNDNTAWVEVSRTRIVKNAMSVAAAATITVPHTPYGSFVTITNTTGGGVTINTINALIAGGGSVGQRLTLRLAPTGAGSAITIADAAGNVSLSANANFTITVAAASPNAPDGLIELQWNGTRWMEMNRTDNV